jgi:eukaryotic-like serine/threonine-protein kinase
MQLWNDYEGRTIAESYPLEKLIRPEGRSAFFSTSNGTGTPAVIRLIEAHFDESEILNRWRVVAEINQINLVRLKKFGQTTLDETPLVYAVMEPTEAALAEVLADRPLTPDETRQVATSLVAALEALHSRNLVHEHIEPANVLAAGEVVKLRSDCIREATTTSDEPNQDARTLKARDVQDLAVLLLQCLTQQRTLTSGKTLPAPFHDIIRYGISGVWGLPQVAAALNLTSTPKPTSRPVAAPVQQQPSAQSTPKPIAPISPAALDAKAYSHDAIPTKAIAEPVAPTLSKPTQQFAPPIAGNAKDVRHRLSGHAEPDPQPRKGLWIAAAIGAILLAFLLWHFLSPNTAQSSSTAQPITTLAAATQPDAAPAPPTAAPATTNPTPSSHPTAARDQWRVVAYTYNHQDQAEKKAATIAKSHPTLNPEVFTPNGHAPYLVTVGGPMTREEANVLKQKARAAGLPRDTYTQNYTAR